MVSMFLASVKWKSFLIFLQVSRLNFLTDQSNRNKNFMLLCGFEKFDNFFVRIDILERLFLKIIENTKDKMFKINSDMNCNVLESGGERILSCLG